MFEDSVQAAAAVAVKKRTFLGENPLGYLIASMLAGDRASIRSPSAIDYFKISATVLT